MNGLPHRDPFIRIEALPRRSAQRSRLTPARTENGATEWMMTTEWAPPVGLIEDDKEWRVKADLPEVKKEDGKVTVENRVPTITGERRFEKEDGIWNYHRIERSRGNSLRRFALPDDADGSKVNAGFKDGALKGRLQKCARAKPNAVEVKVA